MSSDRIDSEWKSHTKAKKCSWCEILLNKECARLIYMLLGFVITYILGGVWYGLIEIKEKIIR
jgi:hypothetical protein